MSERRALEVLDGNRKVRACPLLDRIDVLSMTCGQLLHCLS